MKNPIYQINNLTYINKNNTILNIKNFEIHRGTCYMCSGNMASGKTLLINILTKNIKKYNGEIFYNNDNLSSFSNKLYNNDIAVVSQNIKMPYFKTVKEYLINEISKKHNDTTLDKKLNNIITVMEIKYLLDKKVKSLSPSQARWIELASKIASYPKVLFIDEIEQHLSKKNMESLSKILYRKCNYDGVTLIATTQNPEMFTNLTSVNITLNQGRITKVRSFTHKTKKHK